MQKKAVLIALFVIPIVVYLFFASGVYNFARLPIVTPSVSWEEPFLAIDNDSIMIHDKISVVGFLGNAEEAQRTGVFNLNEKIGKRFGEFTDFQFIFFYNAGQDAAIRTLTNELGKYNDLSKWHFVPLSDSALHNTHKKLKTNSLLPENGYTSLVYIIDKEGKLRGRTDDEEYGTLYGYNTTSVAELTNKMVDDVKVILAEYRLALKKYNKREI
ncbi:MAG: hypothetical protein Q4G08_10455 [Capnocytophaga sp.]|nr:hypothetical protein [Capnocytophaga sp.]